MTGLYIGLMSGTSLDGVDAALVETDGARHVMERGWFYTPFPSEMRDRLRRFCFADEIPLQAFGQLDAELGELFAHCALQLLERSGISPRQVQAIGSHGQTLYHHPSGAWPCSLQIADPSRIAERTGITTVADFRRRDIAAGGQGAPLVPAFHQGVFHCRGEDRAILNIGGIANLTRLPGDEREDTTGFDTGPGNTLLNFWIRRNLGRLWDENGQWARSGHCIDKLLHALLADPYFSASPPKSTGPEYFSPKWLENHLRPFAPQRPQDVQATLTHLTAKSIADQLQKWSPPPKRILVCGGGVHNAFLLELLREYCECPVEPTSHHGVDPDRVEATAFAWLACRTLANRPGNLPAVTGARRPVILGAIFPA